MTNFHSGGETFESSLKILRPRPVSAGSVSAKSASTVFAVNADCSSFSLAISFVTADAKIAASSARKNETYKRRCKRQL